MTNRKLHNSCVGCIADFVSECGLKYTKKPVQRGARVEFVPAHSCEKPNDSFELLEVLRTETNEPKTERTPENGEDSEND